VIYCIRGGGDIDTVTHEAKFSGGPFAGERKGLQKIKEKKQTKGEGEKKGGSMTTIGGAEKQRKTAR